MDFDPNDMAAAGSGIFGLTQSRDQSKLILIPVPWEVTTSYGDGASRGSEVILKASHQVDLFDIETGNVYRHGYFMDDVSQPISELNSKLKVGAKLCVEALEQGRSAAPEIVQARDVINSASDQVNRWVYEQAKSALNQGKTVAVIGGDHSSPFGCIQALSEKYKADFGILHVDAHADLRKAYQGFKHSHASIMRNVMESPFAPRILVQMGIRDFSPDEYSFIQNNSERIHTFFDPLVKRRLNKGESWQSICDEAISHLPNQVYISFDIDGLSPDLCPNTGTPVPGGLSFDQALTLFASIAESGRKIIGFDLCEVALPDGAETEWDGNVGARILFKMCGWLMISNGMNPSRGRDA